LIWQAVFITFLPEKSKKISLKAKKNEDKTNNECGRGGLAQVGAELRLAL
jgi:hypothetical protein